VSQLLLSQTQSFDQFQEGKRSKGRKGLQQNGRRRQRKKKGKKIRGRLHWDRIHSKRRNLNHRNSSSCGERERRERTTGGISRNEEPGPQPLLVYGLSTNHKAQGKKKKKRGKEREGSQAEVATKKTNKKCGRPSPSSTRHSRRTPHFKKNHFWFN